MTDDKTLVIDRVFHASPERVFAAFTETSHLAKWDGPEGMATEIFSNEVSPGGSYELAERPGALPGSLNGLVQRCEAS